MLGKAVYTAALVHKEQKDKGGKAYILHPIRVMMRLKTQDEELMSIAILHDVLEDSNSTTEILSDMGFSDRVINALELLTHDPKDSYEDYIKKIAQNKDAIRVKIEDLRDNSDITRLKGLKEKDFERIKKYNKAYKFLSNTLNTFEECGY